MTTATKHKWVRVLRHINNNHALFCSAEYPTQLSICDLSGDTPSTTDDGPLYVSDEPATIDIFSNGNPGVIVKVFSTRLQESSRVMTSRSVFDAIQAHRAKHGQEPLAILRSPKAQALLEQLL